MALNLNHQTAAQFAARLRARYQRSSREECTRLAWWLLRRINAGDVTDTQVRNAFGMSVAEYTAFKTRLTTLHDHWNAVLAAQGE